MRYLFISILFVITAEPLLAKSFTRLNSLHTNYGVSQFNYGDVGKQDLFQCGNCAAIKLVNPVKVTQIAAIIVYERQEVDEGLGTPGVYLGCTLRRLPPHSSLGISVLGLPSAQFRPEPGKYVEVIWAPEDKVALRYGRPTRIANGLGGYFSNSADGQYLGTVQLAHPKMFSLPSDLVVEGQKQEAIDCICDGISDLDLSGDIFKNFGVGNCTNN